jgi:hypothetical protein
VLTWTCEKRLYSVACESVEEHEAQHYNCVNDGNVMCASMCFEFVGGLVYMICGRET